MTKTLFFLVSLIISASIKANSLVQIVSETPKFALPKDMIFTKDGKDVPFNDNKVSFQSSDIVIKMVSEKDLENAKRIIKQELKKYPTDFISKNISKIILVYELTMGTEERHYYVGPDYILVTLPTAFFGLFPDYSSLSKSLHAAIGEMTLYKHHNYMMLFLFNGGEAPSKNKSYTMDELIKRGYVSDKGVNTFDRYVAEYYKLIYTDPEKIIGYVSQSDNVRKRLCLAIAMYKQDDEKTLAYMTSHHITAQCQGKRFSDTISIELSGS